MPIRVVLNRAGVRQLLQSPEIQADLKARATRIAAAAGGDPGDYEVSTAVGKNRARATVRTATIEAMHDEAKKRSLSRAIDAGRG